MRNMRKLMSTNDGTRTLMESIAVPEVQLALDNFVKNDTTTDRVLIGGCATSYYTKPRSTMDVDFLYKSDADIPDSVNGFKKFRKHSFEDKINNVEVETISPSTINLDSKLVDKVFDTAGNIDSVKVASVTGLISLKLQRLARYDSGDIAALIETGKVALDASWPITQKQRDEFWSIVKQNGLESFCTKCTK